MKLKRAEITNFRRLDNVQIQFDEKDTVFVGPNNSGKTSAATVFRCFFRKRDFRVHDLPLSLLTRIDEYDPEQFIEGDEKTHLPFIRLDLWFSVDVNTVGYARVAHLISTLDPNTIEVGIGCTFSVDDRSALWRDFTQLYPTGDDGKRKRTLSQFLAIENNFKQYFSISYSGLRQTSGAVERMAIAPTAGKNTLHSLLRVDFVDAQRNMQDDEETSRGSKLSAAFGDFYRSNLRHAEAGQDAVRIVEENNERLTQHYGESFGELMGILKDLGVPSANDRELEVVSMLGAEEALRGTTDLFYKDVGTSHSLPEAYNGLGFKNLVLMAIQMRDYQMRWANTEEDRPLCHLIFVEEPEVHLHAQVQQTFIANMWQILDELAEKEKISPQLVVTTHSSHVLNSVDFEKVRYFRRCRREGEDASQHPVLSISAVHNLQDFQVTQPESESDQLSPDEALRFLKRYLTLTHCDLMFADAAILVEGTVERLLLPAMIQKVAPGLGRTYLTTLEVGGAYAHVFAELMAFLHIPYLVITDIDAVKTPEGGGKKKACVASEYDAVTSNGALKAFFDGIDAVSALKALTSNQQTQENGNRFVAFQKPVDVEHGGSTVSLYGRTLEEAFIYENLNACTANGLLPDVTLPADVGKINDDIFKLVRSSSFKKTEFALKILSSESWNTPSYIAEGLSWLAERLDVREDKVPN